MKTCNQCGIEKPLDSFYKSKCGKDGHESKCKECRRSAWRLRYLTNPIPHKERSRKLYEEEKAKGIRRYKVFRASCQKKWIEIISDEFGDLACSKCGYNKNIAAIDFHHHDPSTKEVNFSTIWNQKPTSDRILELKKGVFLCRNCHAEIHNPQLEKE